MSSLLLVFFMARAHKKIGYFHARATTLETAIKKATIITLKALKMTDVKKPEAEF